MVTHKVENKKHRFHDVDIYTDKTKQYNNKYRRPGVSCIIGPFERTAKENRAHYGGTDARSGTGRVVREGRHIIAHFEEDDTATRSLELYVQVVHFQIDTVSTSSVLVPLIPSGSSM